MQVNWLNCFGKDRSEKVPEYFANFAFFDNGNIYRQYIPIVDNGSITNGGNGEPNRNCRHWWSTKNAVVAISMEKMSKLSHVTLKTENN